MADIPWLAKLFSEYPVKAKDGRAIRTRAQVQNLREAYEDYSYDVMGDAVQRYMRVGSFFPSVSDLWPHVQDAIEDNRGDVAFNDEGGDGAIYYGRWKSTHTERVTDDELYAFEEARGWVGTFDDESEAVPA